jgi:hypothetical protein
MRPVAAIQSTPDEQNDIQTELLNLKMSTQKELSIIKTRLLSVEKTIEILAYTNRTNGMVKMNMKRNQLVDYDDVSSSALPSPVRARLGRHLHAWPLRARWPLPTPDPPAPPPPTPDHRSVPRPPHPRPTTHDPRPPIPSLSGVESGKCGVWQTNTSSMNSLDRMIDRMEKEKKKRQREYFVLGLLLAWAWLHHGHLLRFP